MKNSVLFCMHAHTNIYFFRMHFLHEYVQGLLLNWFQYIHKKANSMQSIKLSPFITPSSIWDRREAQVLVILHGPHVLELSTVEELFDRTVHSKV